MSVVNPMFLVGLFVSTAQSTACQAVKKADQKVAEENAKAKQAHEVMEAAEAGGSGKCSVALSEPLGPCRSPFRCQVAKAKALEEALSARKAAEEAKVAEHQARRETRDV